MSESFGTDYTEYQVNRSALRKFVRRAYLKSARAKLEGRVLDFGVGSASCWNPCRLVQWGWSTTGHRRLLPREGAGCAWYDGLRTAGHSRAVPEGRRFESMVVSHVLEHCMAHLRSERLACRRRTTWDPQCLVIVPGKAGYRSDSTHVTFVDAEMLAATSLVAGTAFSVESTGYYPGNVRGIGDWFPHHELQVLFRARAVSMNPPGAGTG